MNIMELGAIGELVGGVAVIGSLIYVGLQLRQNTRQLKSQARFQVFESLNQNAVRLVGSEQFELARAEPTASHPMQFSDDGDRFQFVWTSWLSHAEMLFYEVTDGTLSIAFEKAASISPGDVLCLRARSEYGAQDLSRPRTRTVKCYTGFDGPRGRSSMVEWELPKL